MFSSAVLSTLPIVALFLATVMSAPREDLVPQKFTGFHKTREEEILKERPGVVQNEKFDVSREDELLHRLGRVLEEPLPRDNEGERDKTDTLKTLDQNNANITLRLNTDKSEIKDMMESHVTPQDDDEVRTLSTVDDKRSSEFEGRDSKSKIKVVTVLPTKIFPDNSTTADVRIATPEWLAKLNISRYTTHQMDKNADVNEKEMNTNLTLVVPISSKDSPKAQSPMAESTIATPSTTTKLTAPTITETHMPTPPVTSVSEQSEKIIDNLTTTSSLPTSSSPSPAEMKLHEKKKPIPTPMPSGVAALITAISFAIIVIVTYIGLLVRRRYLEWRYGNRELLVNHFDVVDINNLEDIYDVDHRFGDRTTI